MKCILYCIIYLYHENEEHLQAYAPKKRKNSMSNFIELCRQRKVSPDKFDDYVDEWHDSDSALPLHEYLGMTQEEYARVLTSSDVCGSNESIVNAPSGNETI